MIAARHRSKLMVALLAAGVLGCVGPRRTVPAEALPTRLVLALDGVDYRDVMDARGRGRFAQFHPPARLVSTFPSISDIAWHAIFGVQPPAGYQRVFYSQRQNLVLGDALSAIRPIEYEQRMDLAFDAKFHHLGAYLMSWPVARREVETDVRAVLATSGRSTMYVYNVGPDALQHTRGDIARYLDHLSAQLDSLQAQYRQRTGRALEIIVLSDHGHNRARDAAFVPVTEALAAHGFESARSLHAATSVAFSVDGVTTGFGIFCRPEAVVRVASIIAEVKGVQLVTTRVGDHRFTVQGRDSVDRMLQASIERRISSDSVAMFRYVTDAGDPLQLQPIIDRMRAAGDLDAEGFATEAAWLRWTLATRYPAAVVRIVHGHVGATRNPAPILVSLADEARVGLGMVSVANRMRPLGGTHGALGETNAVGVILSTGVVPHDDVAWRVRQQFGGFDDLRPLPVHASTVQVVAAADLRADRFVQRAWPEWAAFPAQAPMAMLALSARDRRWAGDGAWVRVEVRARDQSPEGGRLLASVARPLASAWRSGESAMYAWPADSLGLTGLPAEREVMLRVQLERRRVDPPGTVIDRVQTVLTVPLRVAADGVPWSY